MKGRGRGRVRGMRKRNRGRRGERWGRRRLGIGSRLCPGAMGMVMREESKVVMAQKAEVGI
jgi:hypothetical protein